MSLTPQSETWRALVADDEPDNLELASEVLALAGAQVIRAANGQEALDRCASDQPNLILLDLAMPGVDGWQAQRALRAQPEWDGTPIIALTALAMPGDIERARDAGFDGYITKPFLVRALLKDIADCVEKFLQAR